MAVADLHWGKVGTFRHAGIPIPHAIELADLNRLSSISNIYDTEHLVILGDLVHHREGLSELLFERIARWRSTINAKISLIKGNHDRWLDAMPDTWRMNVIEDRLVIDQFAFTHHPDPDPSHYVWAGHIHPSITLHGLGDRLKLPCFQIGRDVGILPAFSEFTGGGMMNTQKDDQIFAIAGTDIISMTHTAL